MTTRQAGGVALVLVVLSTFLLVLFHTIELVEERNSLAELRAQQETPLREALVQHNRFEALSKGITQLAEDGDQAAKAALDALRRQGLVLPPHKP